MFRTKHASVESNFFLRIGNLKAQLTHGLPPQLNPDEYPNLNVRRQKQQVHVDQPRGNLSMQVSL
jgi:hypothetical protein